MRLRIRRICSKSSYTLCRSTLAVIPEELGKTENICGIQTRTSCRAVNMLCQKANLSSAITLPVVGQEREVSPVQRPSNKRPVAPPDLPAARRRNGRRYDRRVGLNRKLWPGRNAWVSGPPGRESPASRHARRAQREAAIRRRRHARTRPPSPAPRRRPRLQRPELGRPPTTIDGRRGGTQRPPHRPCADDRRQLFDCRGDHRSVLLAALSEPSVSSNSAATFL